MKVRDCRDKFEKAIAVLSEIYDKPLSRAAIEAYYKLLENYEWQDVKAAFETALRTLKFFPKPAEIIAFLEEDEELLALRAWEALINEFPGADPYKKPELRSLTDEERERTMRVIEMMGGWYVACVDWSRKDFPELYRKFAHIYRLLLREDAEERLAAVSTTKLEALK